MKRLTLIAFVALLVLAFNCKAEPYIVDTPTERTDGTALGLSEIAGIQPYCGTVLGDYQDTLPRVKATLPDTVVIIPDTSGFCVFTVVDIDGREAVYSNPIQVVADSKALPSKIDIPVGIIIRIVITKEGVSAVLGSEGSSTGSSN